MQVEDLYLVSASKAPELRIGLLVDGDTQIATFARVIDQINACGFARIVLVVRNTEGGEAPAERLSLPARALKFLRDPKLRSRIAYASYIRLDERLNYDRDLDPLREVDCTDKLAGVERLDVTPLRKGFVHRFADEDVAAIRARNVDVLLRFGFNILKGDILTAARYGVWSFHHGDNDAYRGAPPQFWEMAERNPVGGVILQVLSEELDNGLVLTKGRYALDPVSLFRNRVHTFRASTHFVIAKLKELHEHGFGRLKARAVPPAPYAGRRTLYRTPTNGEVLAWLIPAVARKIRARIPRRIQHWQVALRAAGGEAAPAVQPEDGRADLTGFRFVPAPKGRLYADPFPFTHEGRTFLFCEDYAYADDRGVISVAEVAPDGRVGPMQVCLDTGSHLSFPNVFAHDGTVYMIPESGAAGHVALYRAEAFPHRWVLEKVLFEGPALDTCLWVEAGTYYFFTSLLVAGTPAVSLHLFTADSLTGEWRAHPFNPISEDVRTARCGGQLIRRGDRLYRPAQDGTSTYGRALVFTAVERLSPQDFREREVMEVGPGKVPAQDGVPADGIHTYNRAGGLEAIDAKFPLPPAQVL